MRQKLLKKIRASEVTIFKIHNRRGYAVVCLNNLTEGKTPSEALHRLKYPLRRMGYVLPDRMPSLH